MQRIETRKDDVVDVIHGTSVSDPYRWLEGDPNGEELRTWLTAHADRSSTYFKNIPIRDTIRDELKRLFERDSIAVPTPRGTRYFYERRRAEEDLAVLYVKDGLDGEPRVLIDPNTLSAERTTVLADWEASRDGTYLMYELSASGNDKTEIRVMNVETGEQLPEVIPDDVYPALHAWNHDGTGFWYARRDPEAPAEEAKFHQRMYFHALGTPTDEDTYVWGKGFGKEAIIWMRLSYDGKYQLAGVQGQEHGEEWTELYVKEVASTDFVRVTERVPGSLSYGHIHRDYLYVTTNHRAPRWKLMRTPIDAACAGTPQFEDVLPEGENVLEADVVVGDRLFATFLHDVHTVMREYTLAGEFVREIPLPTVGSAGGFSCEPEGSELFFVFNSFAYPPTVYRLDLTTDETQVIDKLKVMFDTETIATEQAWCTSKDGTRVPMFLIHKKGIAKDGSNPTLVYGYGGFDISLTPSYMTTTVPFIERGGIFVIANLRGGGEFGKAWHEAGMKTHKQNVFDDFISTIEYLIGEGYTASDKVAISGGSNGGLLVAATLVQRPDLVRAVVCRVPVTDMLRYHLHHGGRHWIPDYGDPDDPDVAAYLLNYSPYHQLKDGGSYPATLITTSDGDDRVHPLHAYKFAARLEEANASEYPILMRVEIHAGHSGAHAISRSVEEDADVWAFVFDQLGMDTSRI